MGQGCLCCERGIPFTGPRICPFCDHVFQGNGWDGVDAHWVSKHENQMPYRKFWDFLCEGHRGPGILPVAREHYSHYINESNIKGSNKASSYIRALDLLGVILKRSSRSHQDFWSLVSPHEIESLYEYALEFQKKEGSEFLQPDLPPSYGRNGYYSAALKSYQQFLIIHRYEDQLWDIYRNPKIAPEELSVRLAGQEVGLAELLIEEKDIDLQSREGREAIREVKTRIGQDFFRKMILSQYQTQWWITGLNVPEVLRASHITSWADDPANRMNPSNGLCLSATYDAAFDKHLISFDDDYRMILSPALRDYYTNKAFKEYFLCREGGEISRPGEHLPDLGLLERHRQQMPK